MDQTCDPLATLQSRPVPDWDPVGNYLMLDPILLPQVSAGGIILPSTAYLKTNRGIVIKAGPEADKDLMGKECFFPANVDYTIEVDENTHQAVYLVRDSDLLMVRTPPTTPAA